MKQREPTKSLFDVETFWEKLINDADAFWKKASLDRNPTLQHPARRFNKRLRPTCIAKNPHLKYQHGQWECRCYLMMFGGEVVGYGTTPSDALSQLVASVNRALDWDRILRGDVIYIDHVILCSPAFVFNFLPPEIKDYYA